MLSRPGQRNCGNINRLTTAPALPAGWSKVGPGLWMHEDGEELHINPASLTTNVRNAHALGQWGGVGWVVARDSRKSRSFTRRRITSRCS